MEYCFSRQPFSPDANMVAVQMQFTNNGAADTKNLHIEDVKLQSGMRVKEFPEIGESLVWWGGVLLTVYRVLRLFQADHSSSRRPVVVKLGRCDSLCHAGDRGGQV